jgi:hypothetical protein
MHHNTPQDPGALALTAGIAANPSQARNPAPANPFADLYPLTRFIAEVWQPQGFGTEQSLRWLLRYRTENGLMQSGAVIEKRTPGAARPRLFVNAPKFAAWLAESDQAAA